MKPGGCYSTKYKATHRKELIQDKSSYTYRIVGAFFTYNYDERYCSPCKQRNEYNPFNCVYLFMPVHHCCKLLLFYRINHDTLKPYEQAVHFHCLMSYWLFQGTLYTFQVSYLFVIRLQVFQIHRFHHHLHQYR
nr:MAG TPA: hypothetical protein [Caudoviricetes sp.]